MSPREEQQELLRVAEPAHYEALQVLRETQEGGQRPYAVFTDTRLHSKLDIALTEVAIEMARHKAGKPSSIRMKIENAERKGKTLEQTAPDDEEHPYPKGLTQPFIDAYIAALSKQLEVSEDVARGRGGVAA
jgi:hypothetical protein